MEKRLKLLEVTDEPWEPRWNALKKVLRDREGIELTASIIQASPGNISETVKSVLESDADVCRFSDSLAGLVMPHLPRMTYRTIFVGVVPLLVREKGQWWPRALLDDSFQKTVSENLGRLDIDSYAMVAGATPATKLIISALVKIGYTTVNITDKSLEASENLVSEMKKKYFQVRFQAIPFQAITTLPGVHSLVVNSTPLKLENDLLDELYFFNFLKRDGVVVDLTLVPSQTPLMTEAQQWGARHLSGDYVAADRDVHMIELLTGVKLPVAEVRELLRKEIDAAPFDPGPFLQRFRERGA